MGVTGLWNILSELSEDKHIEYLRGQKVAVDLSGWVVQANKCKGLKKEKKPHLRNLFYRVKFLLSNDVHPIFVLEGEVPDLKKAVFKKRNCQGNSSSNNARRALFDETLNQCHELLKSLGVPCIKSSGEAEALCALLCAKKIVDGVITNDGDAFLYGANTVYKDFCMTPKETNGPNLRLYSLKSEKNKLELNQRNLIALALLLGCDYCKGVPKIGEMTAVKLLKELKGYDLLQRFQEWKQKSESELFPGYKADMKKKTHCTHCSHFGSNTKHEKEGCNICDSKVNCYPADSKNPCTCPWHIIQTHEHELKAYTNAKSIPGFPNDKVIKEFLEFNDDIPNEDVLDWQCPDLKQFQDKVFELLEWSKKESFAKCFPIITLWQQFTLSRHNQTDKFTLLYKPTEISETWKVRGEDFLKVWWVQLESDNSSDVDEEKRFTEENKHRFKKSYPKMVEEFDNLWEKSKPQPISKTKKIIEAKNDRKMNELFLVKKNTGCEKLVKSDVNEPGDNEKQTQEKSNVDYEPELKKQCLAFDF